MIVDLEGERFVARADQRASDGGGSLADGKLRPIVGARFRDETIETIRTLKNSAEGQRAMRPKPSPRKRSSRRESGTFLRNA